MPLTTIQRLDPIYVDIQQSSADLLRLREQMLSGEVANDKSPVRLQLESGSIYPLIGTLELCRCHRRSGHRIADHPRGLPQPAAHPAARACSSAARFRQGVQARGILVPQRAVSRDERGRPTVLVVGAKGMAELRVIQADRTVGDNWLVTGGLKPGEKVIVDAGPLRAARGSR